MRVSEGKERVCQQPALSCVCATANRLLYFKEVGQNAASILQFIHNGQAEQKADENWSVGYQ